MQPASSFMQLVASGCRRNILYFHYLFEGKTVVGALEWG